MIGPLCPDVITVEASVEAETGVEAEETANETIGAEPVTVLIGFGGTRVIFSTEFLRDEVASGPG